MRKQGLICDAISHSTLPGVCIAFMVLGIKNLEFLLLGAFIAGVIAALFIFGIDLKSKVKFDSALAIVLSTFFGLGVVLLALIQREANTCLLYTYFMKKVQKASGFKGKDLYMPVRALLTGQVHGPELSNILEILGKGEILRRL